MKARMKLNASTKPLIATIAIVALACTSLFIGAANINLQQIIAGDTQALEIVLVSRIPRLLAIALAGAGLSIAGLILHGVPRAHNFGLLAFRAPHG